MQIKMSLQEIAYFCFFGILLVAKGIGLYEGMLSFNVCLLLAFLCMGCKLLLTEYTIREWILLLLLGVISLAAYHTTGEKAVVITVLTVMGLKNVRTDRLLKFAFAIWTVTFYGMILVHIADVTDASILAHNKFGLGFLLRYSMGFPHPNVFHISYFIWMALLLYLFPMRKKKLWTVSFVLFAGNVLIFLYSVSITGFLLVTMYLIFNIYLSMRQQLNKAEKCLLQCVYPACVLISVIPPLVFKGRLYDLLNKLLNTRMNIWKYYLTNFTPKLFGTKVWSPEDAVLSMDCSYLYLLYYYGILLFLGISVLFIYTIWRYTADNRKAEIAIIIGMLIAGITEPYLFNLSFKNLILVFAGDVLFATLAERVRQKEPEKERSSVWMRKFEQGFRILPWGEKEFVLVSVDRKKWEKHCQGCRKVLKEKKKQLLVTGAAAACIGGLAAGILVQVPQKIYVYTGHCDYVKGEGATLEEVGREEGAVIYGVRSEDLRYYGFDGNMLTLERVRGMISWMFGAILLWEISFCAVLCYNQRKRSKY